MLLRPQTDRARDRGATLVEVVIACVLLGILASAVLTIVLQTQAVGVNNRNRVAAANLAAREIDLIRAEFRRTDTSAVEIANAGTTTNKHPLGTAAVGQPLVIDGTPYTVKTSVQWNVTGNGQSACDGGALVVYPTLGVTVAVTWPHMGSTKPVVSTAALAPEKGSGIPSTDSFVAVRVTDAAGHPNPGRGIAVTGGGSNRTGITDAQGCAVVEVSPAAGSGTSYTAKVTDPGYVDISGAVGPSKAVGTISQGQLNNSVTFQVDAAGSVKLRLVDESGASLDAATATGVPITLVASQFSGSSGSRSVTATGPLTTVGGLWPTSYGAYFGTTAPASGYPTGVLSPGGSITLDVTFAAARLGLSDLPAGTSAVYAAPDGTTSCAAAGVRPVDPAAISLLPGTWSFFAAGPTFDCSPGPSALVLVPGDNGEGRWGETTLQVTDAPAGVLWAVHRSKVTGVPVTCLGAATAPVAVNIDGARSGPVPLPAGDWFIYVTDGAAGGGCVAVPAGQYSKVLTYETDNTLAWVTASASSPVTVTGGFPGKSYEMVAWTGGTSINCTALPSGTQTLTKAMSQYTGTLGPGTWYVFQRYLGGGGLTCSYGGKVVVSGSGAALTLPFSTSTPPTVP